MTEQAKERRVEWSKERDFVTLNMLQEDYTDEELTKLGMTPEVISDFRKWQQKT